MKREILIFDEDREYASGLLVYLQSKIAIPVTVINYSDAKACRGEFESDQSSILIISGTLYAREASWIDTERTLVLCEGTFPKEARCMEKYQSAENICKEVIHMLIQDETELTPTLRERKENGNEPMIIGLFTPVSRSCQTTLGLTMGHIYAEKAKTLYLNFESFSGFETLLGSEKQSTLSDLLFLLETNPNAFLLHLSTILQKNGDLYYIPPMDTMQQMLYASAKQWKEVILRIRDEADFDIIIMDLTESVQGLPDILRLCNKVYTLTKEDAYAQAKIRQYENIMEVCDYQDVLRKTIKRKIPYMEELPDGLRYRPFSDFSKYVREMVKDDLADGRIE